MKFPDFIGNETSKGFLREAFVLRRFPHAVVLHGEKGTGRKTLARIIAQAFVCEAKEDKPCGLCHSCKMAIAGSHPDIRILEGGGAAKSLNVDMVKWLSTDAYRAPEQANCNIYLLFPDGKLSEAVQNKLLKLIEEPPNATYFLLVCENTRELLPTILSRIQSLRLEPPDPTAAAEYAETHFDMDAQQALALAKACMGNLGRMQEERENGVPARAAEIARQIALNLTGTDAHALIALLTPLAKDRHLLRDILRHLQLLFRDACVLRAGGMVQMNESDAAEGLSRISRKRLFSMMELPERYLSYLEGNVNAILLVTALCAELRAEP